MMSRIMLWVAVVGVVMTGGAARAQDAAPSLDHTQLIKRGDTVLWIGDGAAGPGPQWRGRFARIGKAPRSRAHPPSLPRLRMTGGGR